MNMSMPVLPEQFMTQLKAFFKLCMLNPTVLCQPELAFVKTFVEHFGGKILETTVNEPKEPVAETEPVPETEPEPEPESVESDLDLDMTGVIEPDTEVTQKMGNPTLQPTEEEMIESQAKRSEAVSAFAEKDYEKAIELYTEAIVLNPQAALLYARRGQIFMLMDKPNACIHDCNRAIDLNPDSAAAHKYRGRAYQLLGKFEEAATDLRLACKFDFDEEANDWLREVTPNARKIEEHKRMKERKAQEKLEQEKQERLKEARDSAKAYEENTRPSQTNANAGYPGIFFKFLNDPEVMQSFQDPEIFKAFSDMYVNPTNILKYQNNPKIMAFINKMASKYGDATNMPGGFSDMMSGMAGAAGAPPPAPPTNPNLSEKVNLVFVQDENKDDVDLD